MAERSCVVCRSVERKSDLLRFVLLRSEELSVDVSKKQPGRGAYVHLEPACFFDARLRALLRGSLMRGSRKVRGANSAEAADWALEVVEAALRQARQSEGAKEELRRLGSLKEYGERLRKKPLFGRMRL